MFGHEDLDNIVSFPDLPSPMGSIRFGGNLSGAGGTGFNRHRTYGIYALVLVLGCGRYRDRRGNDRRVEPGDLIVVFPDSPHQYGPEPGDFWKEIFISFEGLAFEGWRNYGLNPIDPVWPLAPLEDWRRRFEQVLQAVPSTRSQACIAVGAVHAMIADALAARQAHSGNPGWLEFARQALSGGEGAASLEEIARQAGLGYEKFRKAFRQATGESPGRYRKRMRLAQAALMLQRVDLSLETISRSLGFCDAFHFSKDFKAHYGMPPTVARRERMMG